MLLYNNSVVRSSQFITTGCQTIVQEKILGQPLMNIVPFLYITQMVFSSYLLDGFLAMIVLQMLNIEMYWNTHGKERNGM